MERESAVLDATADEPVRTDVLVRLDELSVELEEIEADLDALIDQMQETRNLSTS